MQTDREQQHDAIARSSEMRPRRKPPQRGNFTEAKAWLILIFFALRLTDILVYFGTPPGNKSRLLGAIINTAIWTTSLLIAIWLRKSWARYILIVILILSIFGSMIFIPSAMKIVGGINSGILIMITVGVVNVAIAWFLISSRQIKRLTDKFFD